VEFGPTPYLYIQRGSIPLQPQRTDQYRLPISSNKNVSSPKPSKLSSIPKFCRSLLYKLGLGLSDTGLEPAAKPGAIILSNFLLNYLLTQPRFQKIAYNIDNNANPRPDLSTKGPQAVKDGKLSQQQLDRINRLQSAHNNGLENLPLFTLAILFALMAKVPGSFINKFGLTYTVARVAYVFNYYYVESEGASQVRTVLWWVGNISCAMTIYKAAKYYGASVV
jgi:uncharacterized MAPEG superfamily protein